MKKNDSSNAPDAGHKEARARNEPTTERTGKKNNSNDLRQGSEEQKAGRDKNKRTEEHRAEENY